MKEQYGVVRNVNYQTGEVEIQLDSGLWIEDCLNPADVQDMMNDDVVSVCLNKDDSIHYLYLKEV